MKYRGYYIETDGNKFRAYKRGFIFKKYIILYSTIGGSAGRRKFESLVEAKEMIDYIIAKEPKHKWELVEPLDGIPEL